MNRIITAHTTLPQDQLYFRALNGREKLSSLYEFDVELLSPSSQLNLKSMLGSSVTLEILSQPLTPRYLNGIVTKMTLSGRETSGERNYIYKAVLKPVLWYLTQNKDCRIYQEKTVPEIITSIFAEYNIQIENRLSYDYRIWGYCVQYQESDFNFVSRLMEHEGIYYYFEHQLGSHTLVLADAPSAHTTLPGYDHIVYQPTEDGLTPNIEAISAWSVTDAITPSLFSMDDYDFRKPRAALLEARQNPASYAQNKAEVFEWPGVYTDSDHGQFYVKVRQQEFEGSHEQMTGEATSLGLAPGRTFTLTNAENEQDNRAYMTLGAVYCMKESAYSTTDDPESMGEHQTFFEVIPADINWRPARTTPWPKTSGPQTAEVVGPEGETIWTDKYGRVKLQFHWDRYGTSDENSSCWVRVSSQWAGWKYGGIQIPRIGEEVVVDFINGDPDRPMITGRVYNEDNMPPLDLPADATKMGIVSRTPNGSTKNANHLIMQDLEGEEEFAMHAEKDMKTTVENDDQVHIGRHQWTTVGETVTENYGVSHTVTTGATYTYVAGAVNTSIAPIMVRQSAEQVDSTVIAAGVNDVEIQLTTMFGLDATLGLQINLHNVLFEVNQFTLHEETVGLHVGAVQLNLFPLAIYA